jgi:hypothetical protein
MSKIKKVVKHNWFIHLVKWGIRKIKHKPHIIGDISKIPNQAIFISNHNGASGPMNLITFFPRILVPWGTYQMTQGYFSRWKYLYHTFYLKKLKYSKFRSFLLATCFGMISKILYQGVKLIPSFPDVRMKHTINISIKHLEVGNSILIFPEDSSSGYKDEIESFHSGFIYLHKAYQKKYEQILPIVPIFYSKKENTIIIGEIEYVDYKKTRHDLANHFRVIINELQYRI